MRRIHPTPEGPTPEVHVEEPEPSPAARRRRKAVRYALPVSVAALAAASVGLAPASAGNGAPDLPDISAQELLARAAAAGEQQLSGTVEAAVDLGLPELPAGSGGAGRSGHGGPFAGGHSEGGAGSAGEEGGGKPSADPRSRMPSFLRGDHTLRVAVDGPDRHRLSVVEEAAEYSVIHNGGDVWAYDSGTDSAHHAEHRAKKPGGHGAQGHERAGQLRDLTPQEAARQFLERTDGSTKVSVDGTGKVAGRDAYRLLAEPENAPDATVGSARVAVDAENGVPLSFTLTPRGGRKPVVETAYKEIDFGRPDAELFTFTPPGGTDVTEEKPHGQKKHPSHGAPEREALEHRTLGSGWDTVFVLEGLGGAGPPEPLRHLPEGFTKPVEGDFGTGRMLTTRLVNALVTEDGTVYAGAVTEKGLIKAAEAAE